MNDTHETIKVVALYLVTYSVILQLIQAWQLDYFENNCKSGLFKVKQGYLFRVIHLFQQS